MKTLLISLLMVFGLNAMANDAGCGLGGEIISKNSKLLQLFALTTNGSFFSQAELRVVLLAVSLAMTKRLNIS